MVILLVLETTAPNKGMTNQRMERASSVMVVG